MSVDTAPTSIQPIERSEHRDVNGIGVKAVAPYAYDTLNQTLVPFNAGLVPGGWDALQENVTGATQDIYTFYSGGLAGTVIATITVTYTDTTKSQIFTVVRT